jgi:5-methylcytosine-specific restriction endonuclease McrA
MTTGTAPAAGRPRPWQPRERPRVGLLGRTRKARRRFLDAWGCRCCYCSKALKAAADCPGTAEPMTVEHIVPRVDGGGDHIGNLAPACVQCNGERDCNPLEPGFAARLLGRAAAVQAMLVATA